MKTATVVASSLVFVYLLVSGSVVAGDDGDTEVNTYKGLRAFVNKKGARIVLYRDFGSNRATGKITIIFSELNEVDSNGNAVSAGNHAFNAFDKTDFNVYAKTNFILMNSNGSVTADCLMADAYLPAVTANFSAMACITKSNGTIYLGDETTSVVEGQLKFAVMVQNWSWTTNGNYLELLVNIKIPPGHTINQDAPQSNRPKKFAFGGDAWADFSKQVSVDGVWKSMPSDYPKYVQKGANNYITLRFPRFSKNATYDPTVDPGYTDSTDTGGASKGASFQLHVQSLMLFQSVVGLLLALLLLY